VTDEHLKKLREYNAEDRVVTSHEMKLAFTREADSVIDVKSCIPGIDQACNGFRDGELIVISGPTKNGKTLLAQSLTVNFCKQNNFPLWFSFEVPARQFLSQFPELPLIYMPQKLKPRAMDWFEDRVYESFEKYHSRTIFVDHLHYLVDLARQKQMSIEIGTIIRRLKTLAVNGNFVIFLLCHTTKGKQDGTLSYESIRDSSFISQESDAVIMIKRTPDDGENTARARVEFHRRTGILERTIQLIKINGVLRENATGQYN
jgi:replicative DNA helicase